MTTIKNVHAEEILDSRGTPTIETYVELSDGSSATAACPSGTSTGIHEAVELRDKDTKRYQGKGVLKAVSHVNTLIAKKIGGKQANLVKIDDYLLKLDKTPDKAKIGANATLSVSMAVAKAAAKSEKVPLFIYLKQFSKYRNLPHKLPTPAFNLINGGLHGNKKLNFQEFHAIPSPTLSYDHCLEMGVLIFKKLGELLAEHNLSTLVGHEGGYGPEVKSNADALHFLSQTCDNARLKLGKEVFLGLDCAASNFYEKSLYHIQEARYPLTAEELLHYYKQLSRQYPLLYLEDPLAEDDWDNWQKTSSIIKDPTIIVGDDLTVTNQERLQKAIDIHAIAGVIIKPNQIGTVTQTIQVADMARDNGIKIIVSHRSGETNDDFIADLSVALSSDFVKFGAPCRGERVAKLNRLSYIYKMLS